MSSPLVCFCLKLSQSQLEKVLQDKPFLTLKGLMKETGAGYQCGQCIAPSAKFKKPRTLYLSDLSGKFQQTHFALQSFYKKLHLVEEVLQKFIRPILHKDDGDCEVFNILGNEIVLDFQGACASCPSSRVSTLQFITETIKKKLIAPDLQITLVESMAYLDPNLDKGREMVYEGQIS